MSKGCPNSNGKGVILQHGTKSNHAVRCCEKDGSNCWPLHPCNLDATYPEAKAACSKLGLQLCGRKQMQDDNICCGKGCKIDSKDIWIADDDKGKMQF